MLNPAATATLIWGFVAAEVAGGPRHLNIQFSSSGVFQMKLPSRLTAGLLLFTLVLPHAGQAQSSKFIGIVGGATVSDLSNYYGSISTSTI